MQELNKDSIYWGWHATLLWALLIFILFVALQLAAQWFYIGEKYGDIKANELSVVMAAIKNNGTALAFAAIVSAFFSLAAIAICIKLKKGSSIKEYLELKLFSFKTFLLWFFIVIVFLITSDLIVVNLLNKPIVPEVMIDIYSSAKPIWLLWIALVIAAPLFEEIFFRGFLLPGLSNSFMGPVSALILTSFLWAIIHEQYELYALVIIFFMGILLGLAKMKSKSILLPVLLHGLSNAIAATQTALIIN